MRKIFSHRPVNKVMLGLMGLLLSVMIINSLSIGGSKVLASSSNPVLDQSTDYLTVEYSADSAKTYIGKSAPTLPDTSEYKDWLFAGWFQDVKCTSPIRVKDEATASCYAKFVPTDILSVKCQVLSGTTASSDKTNMRFTTSIDTNQYKNVGFAISRAGKKYTYNTRYAYQRIEASETAGVTYEYSPKVIDTKSEAFVTYTIKNIPNEEGKEYFDTVFMAKPYWTTWDGVRIYGVTKYASVSDSYNSVVNIPVKVTKSAELYTASDFSVVESDQATNETISAVRYNANENYAAIVISGKSSLLSATKYTVTHNDETTPYIHRNLETTYTQVNADGTTSTKADTSWYDVNTDEDEFVIATDADLYGLSYISDNASQFFTTDNTIFKGKTIYVVSDIDANVGRATSTEWSTVEEDGETAIKDATSYEWYKIGTAGKPFAGTFDGQGHTISGINYSTAESYCGFFGKTDEHSTVTNFKLANSFFEYTKSGNAYFGSIAGCGNGTFTTIKSEAFVVSSGNYNGGLIGGKEGSGNISDCWFSGKLSVGTDAGRYAGGIVGFVQGSSVDFRMDHCLSTGELTGTQTSGAVSLAGLCGYLYSGKITITDSLSAGEVPTGAQNASIIGRMAGGSVEMSNTYYNTANAGGKAVMNANLVKGEYTGHTLGELKGCDRYYNDTIALDFVNYWGPVVDGTPELLSFSDNALDVWEGKGTSALPWMIYTEEELKTLATFTTLSENPYNFTDKHVQLGADITVVNADTLEDVQKKATTKDNWKPIGSSSNPFEGTFNGDMKTISGLYYQGSDTYIGLFGYTGNNSTIQNLKLSEACYFESQNTGVVTHVGSVAGCLRGKLDTIKSEATVVSTGQANGGIVGGIDYTGPVEDVKEVKISNVWFGGTLDITAPAGLYSGGIVGRINAPNRDIAIEHCFVAGTIKAVREDSDSRLGGVIGYAWRYRDLSISDSLVTSVIQNINADTGAIIGQATDPDYTLHDVYAVKDATYIHDITGTGTADANKPNTNTSANYSVLDVTLNGYDGWYNTTLNFENGWSAMNEGAPQLTCFKEGTALDVLAGKGQESSPWMINNETDLKLLASLAETTYNFGEKYLKLGADITVDDGTTTNWKPIGSASNAFIGNFNGDDNTISGLYYNGDGTYIGLFGQIGETGAVSNVTLANTTFESTATSYANIGGIVGYTVGGNYTNIKVDDTVTLATTGTCVGGIAGRINWGNTVFDTCWSAATINMKGESAQQAGGIVGRVYSGGNNVVQIKHCLNTGTITSETTTKDPHIGGLCGLLQGNTSKPLTLEISDSLNANNVESQYTETGYVGTIVGTINSGNWKLNQVYGINGYELYGTNEGTWDKANSADYAALAEDAITSDASWLNLKLDYVNYWYPVLDSTPELKEFPASDELVKWTGAGTEESPWIFDDADELKRFAQAAKTYSFAGKYLELGATITVNDGTINWTPIGNSTTPFAGNFNGNGNTISGLFYEGSEANIGLFGYVSATGNISNVTLAKSSFESTSTGAVAIGGIAGYIKGGTYTNLKVADTVTLATNGERAGGIVGEINWADAEFDTCWSAATIKMNGESARQVGGIVGRIYSGGANVVQMKHCLNTGNIISTTSKEAHAGGLCGLLQGNTIRLEISDSLNTDSIESQSTVSGYVGTVIGTINSGNWQLNQVYGIKGYGVYGTNNGTFDETNSADCKALVADAITSDASWLNLKLDYESHWYPVLDSTPELKAFPDSEELVPWEGEGTEESPWVFGNGEGFNDFKRFVQAAQTYDFAGKYVQLGTDIVINECESVEDLKDKQPENWTPIGNATTPFAGNFNGNGNTISGIYCTGSTKNAGIGLFGQTAAGSEIYDFTITKSYLAYTGTGNAYLGSVSGAGAGQFILIKSEAELVSNGIYNGGIIGAVKGNADITNCSFAGSIDLGTDKGQYAGGLIGLVENSATVNVQHCLNKGNLSGDRTTTTEIAGLGGLCGYVYTGHLDIDDSFTVGKIDGKGNRIASIIARLGHGQTDATAEITRTFYANDNCFGTNGATSLAVSEHKASGSTVTTGAATGVALAALKGDGGWLHTELDFVSNWNAIVDSTPELKAFPSGTVATVWEGEGTESSPWILDSADELWGLTNVSPYHTFAGEYIKLGSDIVINEGTLDEIKETSPKNWRPIGVSYEAFAGNFDGDGHTISGLYYKGNSTYVGLFAVTGNNSVIQNLKVKNSYFESTLSADATSVETTSNVYIGSIAGVAYGTYENIKSDAEVVCYGMSGGGLAGAVHHYGTATFDDCWFSGTLYVQGAASHCGGLIGKINARNNEGDTPVKITNCLNSGTIVIDGRNTAVARVGGICGSVTSAQEVIITNCLNAKSFVTMRERASSIIGTIEYTVAEGETVVPTVTLTNVYAIKGLGSDGTYNTDSITYIEEQDGVETEVVNTYSMFHGYHADANMIRITDCEILTEEQLAGANALESVPSLFVPDTNGVVHWAQGVLYPTLNMEGEVLTVLPVMTASNASNTTTLSTGDRNMVTTVKGTTSADYTTYLSELETAGFESYATNEIGTVENEKVISNTYTRDNLVLCATYFEKTDETTISYYDGPVSENLVYNESYVADNKADAKTTLHMLELFHYGNSFVIQLKNGHFIISDGGFEEDLPYLLDYLEDLAGDEKPVIEAWFITHAHGDHTGAFNALWGDREDHELIGRAYVNGVYYSSPSDVILEDPDCGAETLDYTLKRTVNLLRTESGEQTRLYRPQTGQRYYFNDTTIDILLAQEHLALDGSDGARANLNGSSTVSLFTSDAGTEHAQTCLLSGDIEEAGYDIIFANYEAALFDVNFFTLNHHGFNTGVNIANNITADTVLLTVRSDTPVRRAAAIKHLTDKAKESMAWGEGTVVFTLPHTATESETKNYVTLPSNDWIYHEDVDRKIQENIYVGEDETAGGTFN